MELILQISLEEPKLFEQTAAEYAKEIEAATERCYVCAEEPCEEHAKLADCRTNDLTALAIGMLKLECK